MLKHYQRVEQRDAQFNNNNNKYANNIRSA